MSLKFTITYLAAVTNRSSVDRLFGAAVNYIEALLNIESSFLFDVSIVTSKYMQSINKKYRQINKPTDVLSFVFLDGEPKTNLLGEIFINWDDVCLRSRLNKTNHNYESLVLFVHGLLHLLRYDHKNASTYRQMTNLQKKILLKIYDRKQ